MSLGPRPYQVQGYVYGRRGKFLAVADPRYWGHVAAEAIVAPSDFHPGSGKALVDVLGVGRAIARVEPEQKNYGPHEYVSGDALFGRFIQKTKRQPKPSPIVFTGHDQDADAVGEFGQPEETESFVYLQERMAGHTVEKGPRDRFVADDDGRMRGIQPFREGQNITFLGGREQRRFAPYCVIVRGTGLGFNTLLKDNYAIPVSHDHYADHAGPNSGGDLLGQGDSTLIHEVTELELADGTKISAPHPEKAAGLDKSFIVKPQAGGCAAGNDLYYTLAWNLSGDTGPGFGLIAYKQQRGTGGRVQGILGYTASDMSGPFSGGHKSKDKHRHGTTFEGEPVQVTHLHVDQAKWTDESEHFDGRLHFTIQDEPPVGGGVIAVRTWIMFRPELDDPFTCAPQKGGWDLHTRVNRVPVYDDSGNTKAPVIDDPTATKRPIDTANTKPPTEPGYKNPVFDEPMGKPIPGGDSSGSKPGDPGYGAPTVPDNGPPPSDWGPLEERVPSIEGQPRPGNTGDDTDYVPPVPGVGGWHDAAGDPKAQESDPEKETAPPATAQISNHDDMFLNVTGLSVKDHMLSPIVGHFTFFYEHKSANRMGNARGIAGFPPKYTVAPIYQPGTNISYPKVYEKGTANGVTMFHAAEVKSWMMRHDFAVERLPIKVSTPTLGIYAGGVLGFGYLSDKYGGIVKGSQIGQGMGDEGFPDDVYFKPVQSDGTVKNAGRHGFYGSVNFHPQELPTEEAELLEGDTRYDQADSKLKVWNGSEWKTLAYE